MVAVLTGIHVLICMGLIIVVLLQTGRGTGLASVFGGGGGESVFGGRGFGGFLAKATGVLAVLFMVMSITLSIVPRGGKQKSVLGERAAPPPVEAPAEDRPGEAPPGE